MVARLFDAFDGVADGTSFVTAGGVTVTGTLTYSATHVCNGTSAMLTPNTNASNYARRELGANPTKHTTQTYWKIVSHNMSGSGQESTLMRLAQNGSNNQNVHLKFNGLNQITLNSADNTTIVASSLTFTPGDKIRIVLQYNDDAGTTATVNALIYTGGNLEGTTPNETITLTNTPVAAAFGRWMFGNVGTSSGATIRQVALDSFQVEDGIVNMVPLAPAGALYASLLTAGSNTAATSPYASASVAPAANAYLLAATHVTGTAVADPTVTGLGLTWELIDVQTVGGTTRKLAVYGAQCGATPGSGAITFTPGGTLTGAAWAIIQVAGVSPTTPHAQEATNVGTAVASLALTLPAQGQAANRWFAFYATSNNSALTIAAPANWVELSENAYSTPSSKLWTGWNFAGSAPSSVSVSEDASYDFRGIAVEIAAPASGVTFAAFGIPL